MQGTCAFPRYFRMMGRDLMKSGLRFEDNEELESELFPTERTNCPEIVSVLVFCKMYNLSIYLSVIL